MRGDNPNVSSERCQRRLIFDNVDVEPASDHSGYERVGAFVVGIGAAMRRRSVPAVAHRPRHRIPVLAF